MGVGNSRINESIIPGSEIVSIPKNIFQVSKSICKIVTPNNEFGTGFLIKFFKGEENFFCLMSCENVIKRQLIEQKEKIVFYYDNENKIKEIILDKNKRFIKDFSDINIDATLVEIKNSDNITEDYFLLPNINYMNNLFKLNNEKIHIPQFPKGGDLSFSEGEIVEINKYELIHKSSAESGSSGSPLLLKNTTKVIGIHKQGNSKKKENYADSIGPIFNFVRNGFIYLEKEEKKQEENEEDKLIDKNKEIKNQKKISELIDENFFDKKYKLPDYISAYDDFSLKRLYNYFLSEKDSPLILKIYSDIGLVELMNKDGNCNLLKIEEYFESLKEKNKHFKCFYHQDSTEIIYCFKCKRYLCPICLLKESKDHLDNCININKLGNLCLLHKKEISIYCKSCEKTVCEKCFDKFHKFHKEEEIEKAKIKKAKEVIIEKNIKLSKIKEFYDMVQSAYESEPGNHLYRKNVINIGKSIEMERKRNKYDKDLAIYRLEQKKKFK